MVGRNDGGMERDPAKSVHPSICGLSPQGSPKSLSKRTLCSEETFSNLTRMLAACFPKEPRQAGRDLELKASGGELQVDCRLISSSYQGPIVSIKLLFESWKGQTSRNDVAFLLANSTIYSAHT